MDMNLLINLAILLIGGIGGAALVCVLFSRAIINTVKKYDAERKAKKEQEKLEAEQTA